jgi:glycerol-3-phosphate dehydrogenase
MGRESFDLAVVGGGITGAGIALDAASRGLSVALIEKDDFASGTSSRSTKLIHGGLRYLQHFEFTLVREALLERAILTRLAPHLSQPIEFLVPLYAKPMPSALGGGRFKLGVGLWLYDRLAGRHNVAAHRWVSKVEALKLAPRLEDRGLSGAFVYYDCLTNDSRLVIEVIKEAAARGALVVNYAAARVFAKTGNYISGIEVEDRLGGRNLTLRARVVVNATGVWSDKVSALDGATSQRNLRPSKGIHVVVPAEKLGNQAAVLIPSLGEQRFLFVVPWCGRAVIGTTDSDYTGDLDDPVAEQAEVTSILGSAARFFPAAEISEADVISTFAGLRPLVSRDGRSTAEVSRKEEILESPSGMVSIIGGKLTTYRRMAERVVDLVSERLLVSAPCKTREIPLAAADSLPAEIDAEVDGAVRESGLPADVVRHLLQDYGGHWRDVLELGRQSEQLGARLVEGLPHIAAEVVYAARFEMAATADDFLARRSRIALLAVDHGRSCANRVKELIESERGSS